jgi:hypothetical protein
MPEQPIPSSTKPERWSVDVGAGDIATLDVAPALGRARLFDVDVRFLVLCPEQEAHAWHALTVELDGRRQWSRTIETHNPGQTDSLDYHCRVEVAAGAGLRVRAATQVHGALRRQLRIEAEEQ